MKRFSLLGKYILFRTWELENRVLPGNRFVYCNIRYIINLSDFNLAQLISIRPTLGRFKDRRYTIICKIIR